MIWKKHNREPKKNIMNFFLCFCLTRNLFHLWEINFLYNSWKYHNSHVKINFASNVKTLNILYLYCHSSCDIYITRVFFSISFWWSSHIVASYEMQTTSRTYWTLIQKYRFYIQTKDKYWCLKLNFRIILPYF